MKGHTAHHKISLIAAVAMVVLSLSACSGGATTTNPSVASTSLDEAGISALIDNLEFAGEPVEVAGDISIVVKDGHTWVSQKVVEADSASEVATCAKGSAALSAAIGAQTVEDEDPTGVTWVVEGPDGNVDIALTQPPEASTDGSLSDALEGSNGYTMNDECLDAAKKEAPEAEASKGTPPTLPDGSDVKVDEAAPEPEQMEQTAKQEDSKSDTPTTSGSKNDSSDSSSPKDSSSGSGSTSGSKPSGGSSTSGSSSSSSSGNAPSTPAKQKTWVDEVGHWEQKQTGQNWVPWQYREYTLYTCAGCGFSTESEDAIGAHQIQAVKDYYNNGSHSAEANYYAVPKSEKIGGGYYEPVYENVWVVGSPGHWE